MISCHLHRKFQFWNFFYLVTKTSTQLLNLDPGGSGGETYIKWKAWRSSFRKYWVERESSRKWGWNDAFKKWARRKFSQMAPHVLKIYILNFFSCFCIRKHLYCKNILLVDYEWIFKNSIPWFCLIFGLKQHASLVWKDLWCEPNFV